VNRFVVNNVVNASLDNYRAKNYQCVSHKKWGDKIMRRNDKERIYFCSEFIFILSYSGQYFRHLVQRDGGRDRFILSFSERAIADLIENNLYDVKIAPKLEEYLQHQTKTGKNDFEANRHLLKLYVLSPETCKQDILGLILIKALSALPSNDFLACSYLLPENLHEMEPIKTLFKLANLLETGQFKQFWKELSVSPPSVISLISTVNGFHDSIRLFIGTIVSCTYQSVPVDQFQQYLNLSEKKSFDSYISSHASPPHCWKLVEEDSGVYIQFLLDDENANLNVSAPTPTSSSSSSSSQTQNKPITTTIPLDQMTKILARIR